MVRGVLHRVGERDRLAVVGQLAGLVARRRDLAGQLLDAGDAGAGDGLVRRGDQPDQPRLVVQRLEHRHRGHGGAVRVGDDALAGRDDAAASRGLTSETTSGMSGSLRKALELSTTMTPASANFGASAREVVAPAENSAMSRPRRVGGGGVLDGDSRRPAYGSTVPAERAEAKNRIVADREVALGEDLAHRDADLAGGADDADVERCAGSSAGPP